MAEDLCGICIHRVQAEGKLKKELVGDPIIRRDLGISLREPIRRNLGILLRDLNFGLESGR